MLFIQNFCLNFTIPFLKKYHPKERECAGDLHMTSRTSGPRPFMVSLNHQPHRKCIGFADLQVSFLLQHLRNAAWSYQITGIAQLRNFQHADSKFKNIRLVIVGVMEPESPQTLTSLPLVLFRTH